MLIGEVELAHLSVLPNKTDFDGESKDWGEVEEVLYNVLKPHIDDLLSQTEEDRVTREEKKRLNEVRQVMMKAVELMTREDETPTGLGEGRGRKPQGPEVGPGKPDTNGVGPPKQPRTTPPDDAVGRLKRLGAMPPWEIRVLDREIRSDWATDQGRLILVINKTFPLYQEWKGHELYIAETATLDREYLQEVNNMLVSFCKIWNPQ